MKRDQRKALMQVVFTDLFSSQSDLNCLMSAYLMKNCTILLYFFGYREVKDLDQDSTDVSPSLLKATVNCVLSLYVRNKMKLPRYRFAKCVLCTM